MTREPGKALWNEARRMTSRPRPTGVLCRRNGWASGVVTALAVLPFVPAPATAEPAPLVAQILSPAPGFKLRPGYSVPLRVRVTGGAGEDISWKVVIQPDGKDPGPPVASGTARGSDIDAGSISNGDLERGLSYSVRLVADDGGDSVTAQATILASDPAYSLIPAYPNNTGLTGHPHGGDSTGSLLFYTGPYSSPVEIIFVDRPTGRRRSVIADIWSSYGVKLSADGSRLLYRGSFPIPGTSFRQSGIGYHDLASGNEHLIAAVGDWLFSTDTVNSRTVYQAQSAMAGSSSTTTKRRERRAKSPTMPGQSQNSTRGSSARPNPAVNR